MIVVDLDGTVADCSHRLHFIQGETKDWTGFFKASEFDKPIEPIVSLVEDIVNNGKVCLFLTGRSDMVEDETLNWITNTFPNFIKDVDYHLVMRKEGDHRPDHEVKPELLADFKTKMNHLDIDFILEDRSSVVKKGRELGYTCLQVAEGDF